MRTLTSLLRVLRMSCTSLMITSQALLIRIALSNLPQSLPKSMVSKSSSLFAQLSMSCTGLRISRALLRRETKPSWRLFKPIVTLPFWTPTWCSARIHTYFTTWHSALLPVRSLRLLEGARASNTSQCQVKIWPPQLRQLSIQLSPRARNSQSMDLKEPHSMTFLVWPRSW